MLKRIASFKFGEKESDFLIAKRVIFFSSLTFVLVLLNLLIEDGATAWDTMVALGLGLVFLKITYHIGDSLKEFLE